MKFLNDPAAVLDFASQASLSAGHSSEKNSSICDFFYGTATAARQSTMDSTNAITVQRVCTAAAHPPPRPALSPLATGSTDRSSHLETIVAMAGLSKDFFDVRSFQLIASLDLASIFSIVLFLLCSWSRASAKYNCLCSSVN
jgi:hypothetical protein